TVLSIGAGYAFGTMRFRGSTVLFYLFLVGMMIPAEATVIPLFFDLRTLGLTDTYLAIAMPQVAQSIAFGTFWLRAQFRATPTSLVEAAAIDGARPLQALVRILVPASRPAIVTMLVLVFMWTWNEFLIALVMAPSGRLRTAPLGLANFQGPYTSETALLAPRAVIVPLPTARPPLFPPRPLPHLDPVPVPPAPFHPRNARRSRQVMPDRPTDPAHPEDAPSAADTGSAPSAAEDPSPAPSAADRPLVPSAAPAPGHHAGASTPAPPEAAGCQDWDPLAAQRTADCPPLDVLLSGTVFFDIVFTGMDRLPQPGEELWSKGMGSSPGGIAN